MRISAITLNYFDRKDYNKNIKNSYKNSNYRDVVSFRGEPNTKELKFLLTVEPNLYEYINVLAKKGIGYKGQILEYINQVRVNISDILRENGLYPYALFNYLEQGSKTAQRLDCISSRTPIEKGKLMGEVSDIIPLSSKKHPDAKLKIEKQSHFNYAWVGYDRPSALMNFIYEDKKLKLNSPYAYFTTDDDVRLYLGFRFPKEGNAQKSKILFNKEIKTLSSEKPYFVSLNEDSLLYHIYDKNSDIDYAFKYEYGKDNLVGIRLIDTGEKCIFKPDGTLEFPSRSKYFTSEYMYSPSPGTILQEIYYL